MEKKKQIPARFFVALIPVIAIVIFNILVFTILGNKVSEMKKSFWCGYAFLTFGFAAMAATTLTMKMEKGQIFSQKAPMFVLSLVYVTLNVIINVVGMIVNSNAAFVGIIVADFILFLIYLAFAILAYLGLRHINNNRQEVKAKTSYINSIKASAELLAERAKDAGLKRALQVLAEDVKYSDPMSGDNDEVLSEEARLKGILSDIETQLDLLDAGSSTANLDTIKVLVVSASNSLKKRNALIRAAKS